MQRNLQDWPMQNTLEKDTKQPGENDVREQVLDIGIQDRFMPTRVEHGPTHGGSVGTQSTLMLRCNVAMQNNDRRTDPPKLSYQNAGNGGLYT